MDIHLLIGMPLGTIILPEILRSGTRYRWWICWLLLTLHFFIALYANSDRFYGWEFLWRSFGSTILVQAPCAYAFYRLFPKRP